MSHAAGHTPAALHGGWAYPFRTRYAIRLKADEISREGFAAPWKPLARAGPALDAH